MHRISNALLLKRVLQHHTEVRLKQVERLIGDVGVRGGGGGVGDGV